MTAVLEAGRAPIVLFLAPSACLWGGVQTWLDQTALGLRGHGWQVLLGLVEGPVFHDPVRYAEVHTGHRVVPVLCRTGTPEGRTRAVLRVIEGERPDLLVVVNVADGLEAARRWKARHAGGRLRVAYSIHAFLPGQFADLLEYRDTVDRVVTTNRLMQRAMAEVLNVEAGWVGYAAYGVEAPLESPATGRDKGRPLRLAWVGRIEEPQKRAADLGAVLRCCQEFGVDFTCDVAGDGPSAESLRSDLADLEAAGRVRFLGYVSRDELYRQVYPGLDALLLTSTWETGPIVAWEAMRHGATVVSTRYVGLEEEGALIHGENCLLAPVGDVAGLAASIARIGEDRNLCSRLAAAARETADSRYALGAGADAWDRELRTALGAPAGRLVTGARPRSVSGRLDRFLGPVLGESVRELLSRSAQPRDPGDEWPHEIADRAIAVGPIERRLEQVLGDGGRNGAPAQNADIARGRE